MDKLKMSLGAIYMALKNPQTPIWLKFATILTVVYILSPIDLIPDYPILGYIDDVTLLSFMIFLLKNGIPKDVIQRSQEEILRRKHKMIQDAEQTANEVIINYSEPDDSSRSSSLRR
jgi:uncharacterized membrane protein YkvA (DUF1232 family)